MNKKQKTYLNILFFSLISLKAMAQQVSQAPWPAYIKPGSVLTRISDNKSFIIDTGVYVKVKETHPSKRDLFNVFNNKGELVYTTLPQYVSEISEDIRVHPKVNAEIIYPPRSELKSVDESLRFNTQFNIHVASLDPSLFSNFYATDSESINTTRMELRAIYEIKSNLNVGLTGNYQYGSWLNFNSSQVKFKNYSIGPIVEYKFYHADKLDIKATFSGEFSPMYQTKSLTSTEDYSSLIYQLGLELNYETIFGVINAGINYRKHDININSSTLSTSGIADESISYGAFGMMVGYTMNWSL